MDAFRASDDPRPMAYQLCRTATGGGAVDLVLNLFVGREAVSVTTIARLAPGETAPVVRRCVSHLERLGIRPVDDAIARARAA